MGSAASVDSDGGNTAVNKEKCKQILAEKFDEAAFDKLADANGCITMKQLNTQVTTYLSKEKDGKPAPVMTKKEQWRSTRNINLAIAKDDKDLCRDMFGELYTDELFASIADEDGCISQEQMMVELAKLKASAAGGAESLTAQAAAALFTSKLQTGIAVSCDLKQLKGLGGRILQSTSATGFEQLRGDSQTLFPFVVDYKGLHNLLQCSDGWHMMLKVGWTETGLREKLADTNAQFKLIIFANDSLTSPPVLATWDNILSLVSLEFPVIGPRLLAHADALKGTAFVSIDPEGVLDGTDYMSVEQYESASDTLLNARIFLKSQFDLYSPFKGDGTLPDGTEEFVIKNTAVTSIKEAQVIDVVVSDPVSVV